MFELSKQNKNRRNKNSVGWNIFIDKRIHVQVNLIA